MTLTLSDFDVDPVRGFLPGADPLSTLPPLFSAWDDLAARLPLFVMSGRVCDEIAALPVLDAAGLTTIGERRRALLLLAGFANTWVAAGGGTTIPTPVAVPLVAVADALGMMPITCHATIVLWNWKRIDPSRPLGLDNVDTQLSFRGSIDEKWFFLSTMGVELAGAPVLGELCAAVAFAEARAFDQLAGSLDRIAHRLDEMIAAFVRVREQCDPHIFYNHVRPYLASWPQPGAIYSGTTLGPVVYSGGSAAQSSLLQSIDAALGIAHGHALTHGFLADMRRYMPPRHRAFIEALETRSIVRTVVMDAATPDSVRRAYDAAVGALDKLRRRHIGLVSDYITRQMPANASAVGTGGTSFDDFLRQSRLETVTSKIGDDS